MMIFTEQVMISRRVDKFSQPARLLGERRQGLYVQHLHVKI